MKNEFEKKIKSVAGKCNISVFAIMILCGISCYYVSQACRNLVQMDFWRLLCNHTDRVFNGGWTIDNLWYSEFGQRNFLQLFLFLMDIRFFDLNCLWESYAGIFVIVCTAIAIVRYWYIQNKDIENQGAVQALLVPVLVALFSLNQWEILSLQFSFAFMIRIFGYVTSMLMVDKLLHAEKPGKAKFLLTGLYIGVYVDLASQLYWPGLLMMLAITWGIDILRKKKIAISMTALFWIPILISVYIYLHGADMSGSGGNSDIFSTLLENGHFFYGIMLMILGSIFPQSIIQKMSESTVVVVGILLFIVVLIAVILFFCYKMQNKTYVPMMLCAYGLLSIPIIVYGRAGVKDLFSLSASRYCCETTLIWAGVLMTFALTILQGKKKYILGVLGIFSLLIFAEYTEFRTAPYRGAYKERLLDIIVDIDEYEDEELAGFQAGSPELVRRGTELMRKYSLNIFSQPIADNVGYTLEDAKKKNNVWEDGWIGENASFRIQMNGNGVIPFMAYDPFYMEHPEGICNIYVNGELYTTIDVAENQEFAIYGQPGEIMDISIECDYYTIEAPPGERKLCFILWIEEADALDEAA